ncbi:hypothetical protein [Nocardia aurantia]|uniref:Uncharacterized protein n=1 Tax=Nocardia aurantia TaxID=2585199 RepID=A0A7K0DTS6_9NOCA|nr:hypothetical protein [Nocardia aurantia]MQY28752.1 hypothetical protein [Nocardia aurantia]
MVTEPIDLMSKIASDLSAITRRAANALADRMEGFVRTSADGSEILKAAEERGAVVFRFADEPEKYPAAAEFVARLTDPAAAGSQRLMYRYTSRAELEEILGTGTLRPSRDPSGHRGQFVTSIAPGTISDLSLSGEIGVYHTVPTHYLALDVSRVQRKVIHLWDSRYLIRNRRSLYINRLIVHAGENPEVH